LLLRYAQPILSIAFYTYLKCVTAIQDLITQFNYIFQSQTVSFSASQSFSGTVIWNSLPLFLKNSSSVNSFKSQFLKWKQLVHG